MASTAKPSGDWIDVGDRVRCVSRSPYCKSFEGMLKGVNTPLRCPFQWGTVIDDFGQEQIYDHECHTIELVSRAQEVAGVVSKCCKFRVGQSQRLTGCRKCGDPCDTLPVSAIYADISRGDRFILAHAEAQGRRVYPDGERLRFLLWLQRNPMGEPRDSLAVFCKDPGRWWFLLKFWPFLPTLMLRMDSVLPA